MPVIPLLRRFLSDAWLATVVGVAIALALGCIYIFFILPLLVLEGLTWLATRPFRWRKAISDRY
jgi:hypothetical protein